jgi:predicted secreted hydrolase
MKRVSGFRFPAPGSRFGGIVLAGLLALPAAGGISFPRDHGSHPQVPVEWWYWTGHLSDRAGRAYGFQLTFFRVRDLQLAHFAWTDAARREFSFGEKMHLALPGIAMAAEGRLDVANEDWSARARADGAHVLAASGRAGKLRLTLVPRKSPVLHGEEGLSKKGAGAGEYSRYVSITRLAASGTIERNGRSEPLSGTAWFDHEWGPGILPKEAAGWDWFAVQLSDGSELLLYRMRRADGAATPFSAGTFVPPSGGSSRVDWSGVQVTETRFWTSPKTRARYPAGWRVGVPALGLELAIDPIVAAQELETPASTGVTYWEGACSVKGSRAGRAVSGRAYVELTGYAGRDVPGIAVTLPVAARSASSSAGISTSPSASSRP